jgi:hypothetical protein
MKTFDKGVRKGRRKANTTPRSCTEIEQTFKHNISFKKGKNCGSTENAINMLLSAEQEK